MPEPLERFLWSLGVADPTGPGWLAVVGTFVLAAVATWRFIPTVRAFALKVGWADPPSPRRLNRTPLPNAGGLAIYGGVLVALVLAFLLRPNVLVDVQLQVFAIMLGGAVLVLTGFVDDQFGLPPLFRLGVQVLTALLLYATGIRIEAAFGSPIDPALSFFLTVLWIVGVTNAMNLIDGVDGLAGGVGFITAMGLLAVSAQFEARAAATLVLAALGGAALGFLRHNLHPSRIIMGDAGAYFFGYVLAASSILGNLKITTVFALLPPLLFLLIPVVDTAQVIVRRLLAGQNPLSTPGKDHLHHRLLARGLSQHQVAYLLWGATLLANLTAMLVQGMGYPVLLTTTGGTILLLGFAVWRRRRAALREAQPPDPETQAR